MKPELLAPAGSLEKLKWAVVYGADAVYFGLEFGSLRNFAGNFTLDEAAAGLSYLHSHGRKGFVTLNIYPYSDEFDRLTDIARTLSDIGADAFIVSDLGVITALNQLNLKPSIHISTQANTVNYQSAMAYRDLGASRINLARELSLEQIKKICKAVNRRIETEVFINGSVCFSYSGRCAISDYLSGFGANRGECKHPCRWKYALVEETRPGEYMPVFEDSRGAYIFNCKDLALFPYAEDLAEAGVNSFKIEGRMKSIHYIASTVSFYRQVIDGRHFSRDEGLKLLSRIPNRGYSAGFMKGGVLPQDYSFEKSFSKASSIFVGNVLEKKERGRSVIEVRNKIHAGDVLECLTPEGELSTLSMPKPLIKTDGESIDFANHSQFILSDHDLPPYTILRRIIF